MFYSTKRFKGYSTCFRQYAATHSHCRFLHGYSLEFKVVFVGILDERNWVCDFGGFKKNGIKSALSYLFDHTTVVAADDPELEAFKNLNNKKIIQLRVIPSVGAERFSEYVYFLISHYLLNHENTKERVFVKSVECFENSKNSALYINKNIEEEIKKNELDFTKKSILERCKSLGLP
tara:strand:+ start:1306 stop:1836 length:531 start_codon:yes stop_codon:yes gene_type:complete